MVPFQSAIWILPVDSPSIIARVDVAGQSALVPMQLLSNKVHLARQCGFIARRTKVVGISWDAWINGGGIVIRTDLGGELARDHGHSAGGTQR